MEEQSTPKSLSCIPCAKRKVRCDRMKPCSHCKRRKQDICEYPLPIASSGKTQPSETFFRMQQDRIGKLEQYIASAGGDLDQLFPALSAVSRREASSDPAIVPTTVQSSSKQGTKRSYDGFAPASEKTSRTDTQAGLVEHNNETTFIEAPMWYSWSEARKLGNGAHESQQGKIQAREPHNDSPTGYSATLLDQPSIENTVALYRQHPSRSKVLALWNAYLTNVHPVVKIFFDWDKEPLVNKAAADPANLSQGQQALVFAIYFIAILSLSDEQCKAMFISSTKSSVLNDFQSSVEIALQAANYAATNDLLVLQAFMLYLLAMRNRAKPTTFFSLMGIAVRIGQRLGLHRDGSLLGLSPMKAEERRRVWWELQHMEKLIGQLVGCISMTLYGDWDTKLPANLEDDEVTLGMETLPPDRQGLTSMSHCLWRYYVLYLHRERKQSDHRDVWITSSHVSLAEKEAMMERYKTPLAEKFLQHCEPVNPLHVHIQIGIQAFLLAMQRTAHLPGIASARMSEMSQSDRDDFLMSCIKSLEYYILAETTPSIAHLRWHNENYFQWTAFVYIVIEAHHRASTSRASSLWTFIDRVCELHPKLTTAVECPEISAIGRLIILAWQERQDYLQEYQRNVDKPWCVSVLEKALSPCPPFSDRDVNGRNLPMGVDNFGTFDFDLIDWSFWETGCFFQAGHDENIQTIE